MKPKYWATLILATIAACACVFYYLNQPAPGFGPVPVHHVNKAAAIPQSPTLSPVVQSQINPSGTSTTSSVEGWKTYTNSQYGFSFEYPTFTPKDYINYIRTEPDNASLSEFDFDSWNQSEGAFDSDFIFFLSPNDENLPLKSWFEKNVDYKGLLLSDNVFGSKILASGIPAIVEANNNSIPQSYIDNEGPISDVAYIESPDGKYVFSLLIDGQDNNFDEFGYGNQNELWLAVQVLSTFKFTK
jgi:hypothetical protein